jgi:TolA-binding protein
MKHVWYAMLLALAATVPSVLAQDLRREVSQVSGVDLHEVSTQAPAPKGQAEARIVQLEVQLQQAQREIAVLRAQLAIAVEPQTQKSATEKMDAAAKAMGCKDGIDWNAVPPVCLNKEGPK